MSDDEPRNTPPPKLLTQSARSRPNEISNTASILLRRFYLSNSILSFDPLKMLVAAIFLASKVEDRKISSKQLSEHVASLNKEVSVDDIISHELLLMEVRKISTR